MMTLSFDIYLFTFSSILVVSLLSLLGILLLSFREELFRCYLSVFISVAVGALLGDAFIHLIPEALAEDVGHGHGHGSLAGILIIIGILIFFLLEKFLHWHHHGEDVGASDIHPVGKLVLVSDVTHNFLDGVVIAASFAVSPSVGLATTLAVILHEIPQEVGDFAVLLHAGYTKWRALLLNFLSALSAVFGAVLFFVIGEFAESFAAICVPLTAGGFIYIAVADLIPELQKTKHWRISLLQSIAVILGVGAMLGLTFLE